MRQKRCQKKVLILSFWRYGEIFQEEIHLRRHTSYFTSFHLVYTIARKPGQIADTEIKKRKHGIPDFLAFWI
jgi:hypothetical protein